MHPVYCPLTKLRGYHTSKTDTHTRYEHKRRNKSKQSRHPMMLQIQEINCGGKRVSCLEGENEACDSSERSKQRRRDTGDTNGSVVRSGRTGIGSGGARGRRDSLGQGDTRCGTQLASPVNGVLEVTTGAGGRNALVSGIHKSGTLAKASVVGLCAGTERSIRDAIQGTGGKLAFANRTSRGNGSKGEERDRGTHSGWYE